MSNNNSRPQWLAVGFACRYQAAAVAGRTNGHMVLDFCHIEMGSRRNPAAHSEIMKAAYRQNAKYILLLDIQ